MFTVGEYDILFVLPTDIIHTANASIKHLTGMSVFCKTDLRLSVSTAGSMAGFTRAVNLKF